MGGFCFRFIQTTDGDKGFRWVAMEQLGVYMSPASHYITVHYLSISVLACFAMIHPLHVHNLADTSKPLMKTNIS